jgi:XapX domain-containing protein
MLRDFLLSGAVGLAIGGGCRALRLPLPAPFRLGGAFLVAAMSVGYIAADAWLRAAP